MDKKTAVDHFGTAQALAKALGVTKQAVSDWGANVPLGRQYQLEIMTGGELKAERPPQDKTG